MPIHQSFDVRPLDVFGVGTPYHLGHKAALYDLVATLHLLGSSWLSSVRTVMGQQPDYAIERRPLQDTPDDDLTSFNDIMEAAWFEVLPNDPERPAAELIADLRSYPASYRVTFFIARDEGSILGFSQTSWQERPENRDKARVSLHVDKSARGKGLGIELLQRAAEEATADDRTLLVGSVTPGSTGEGFLHHIGAVQARAKDDPSKPFAIFLNRLYLDEVGRGLLREWEEKTSERTSGYEVMFWEGRTTDELIEDMVILFDAMNTAPHSEHSEEERATVDTVRGWEDSGLEWGWIPWTFAAREASTGALVGFTRIYPSPFRPMAFQEETVVLPAHRGYGLGKWLKAAMLRKLIEERPETQFVETGNATINAPMLAINQALGFRPVVEFHRYEIGVEEVHALRRSR